MLCLDCCVCVQVLQAIVKHEHGKEAVRNMHDADGQPILAAIQLLAQQSDHPELQLEAAALLPDYCQHLRQ